MVFRSLFSWEIITKLTKVSEPDLNVRSKTLAQILHVNPGELCECVCLYVPAVRCYTLIAAVLFVPVLALHRWVSTPCPHAHTGAGSRHDPWPRGHTHLHLHLVGKNNALISHHSGRRITEIHYEWSEKRVSITTKSKVSRRVYPKKK